jgi:hypothetical protein
MFQADVVLCGVWWQFNAQRRHRHNTVLRLHCTQPPLIILLWVLHVTLKAILLRQF